MNFRVKVKITYSVKVYFSCIRRDLFITRSLREEEKRETDDDEKNCERRRQDVLNKCILNAFREFERDPNLFVSRILLLTSSHEAHLGRMVSAKCRSQYNVPSLTQWMRSTSSSLQTQQMKQAGWNHVALGNFDENTETCPNSLDLPHFLQV